MHTAWEGPRTCQGSRGCCEETVARCSEREHGRGRRGQEAGSGGLRRASLGGPRAHLLGCVLAADPQGQTPPVPVTVGACLPEAAAPPPAPTPRGRVCVTWDRWEHPGRLQGPWGVQLGKAGTAGVAPGRQCLLGTGTARSGGQTPHPGSWLSRSLEREGHQERRQRSHTCAVCSQARWGTGEGKPREAAEGCRARLLPQRANSQASPELCQRRQGHGGPCPVHLLPWNPVPQAEEHCAGGEPTASLPSVFVTTCTHLLGLLGGAHEAVRTLPQTRCPSRLPHGAHSCLGGWGLPAAHC